MRDEQDNPISKELVEELRRTNELLATQVRLQSDWRLAIRNGVLSGLGGVLGATIVAAIVLAMLRPALEQIGLSNLIERGSEAAVRSGDTR